MKLLTPTPAASLWKTFGVFTKSCFGLAWLGCLPVELILHRNTGKRYANTAFFVIALLLLGLLAQLFAGPTISWTRAGKDAGVHATGMEEAAAALGPFAVLTVAALVAFFFHYCGNRERFGRDDQGHSFDLGIPLLVFPPWYPKEPPEQPGEGVPADAPKPPAPPPISTREGLAYPAAMSGQLGRMLRHHVDMLKSGESPYGMLSWYVIAFVEPMLLIACGVLFYFLSSYSGFGVYLGIVGVGLFLKASILQAEWRERIYDDCDQRLEAEAMRNWRGGKPNTPLSRAFTVPVMRAALPSRRPIPDSGPVKAGPGFESLMRPAVQPTGSTTLFPADPTT
ncbi:MAG: hypothetical protein ACKVS8_08775 [Phycisphaerales bacterium]